MYICLKNETRVAIKFGLKKWFRFLAAVWVVEAVTLGLGWWFGGLAGFVLAGLACQLAGFAIDCFLLVKIVNGIFWLLGLRRHGHVGKSVRTDNGSHG
ncbi:MAG: hypothetical protein WCY11_08305 [Novosphingobium sp.]